MPLLGGLLLNRMTGVLAVGVAGYLVLCIAVFMLQRSLIYAPLRTRALPAAEAGFAPGKCHDLRCQTDDGLSLNGWLLLRSAAPAAEPRDVLKRLGDGAPVVLYFGGNGGNRSRRLDPMEVLSSFGAHVVLFDHRGYGDNPGRPSEERISADAQSIWKVLTGRLGIAPGRIVIYGESLGGGIATRLAADVCRAGQEPRGLILQSTFTSLAAAGQRIYWFLPVKWLLVDRYESVKRLPDVTCPILQLHGRNDQIVPLDLGQRLFEAAPAKSRGDIAPRQVILERTNHNDVYRVERDRVLAALQEFLQIIEPGAESRVPSERRGDRQ